MDICRLTPSERADTVRLLEEYQYARKEFLASLKQIEDAWTNELLWQTREYNEAAEKRLDTLVYWITMIDTVDLDIDELD